MRNSAALLLLAVLVVTLPTRAQSPPNTPPPAAPDKMEVIATIRPNKSGDVSSPVRVLPGIFTATNYRVIGLVTLAYELQFIELLEAPAWTFEERYDIVAKSTGPEPAVTNLAATRQMLKTLLADRFHLVLRKEVRELPIYTLELARSDRRLGAGLRPSTQTCELGKVNSAAGRPCGLFGGTFDQMKGDAVTIAAIAKFVSGIVERIVVDRTGLPGTFDLDLSFTRGISQPEPGDPPLIFTAVKEQLGLELKAQKAPVEITVVQRMDRPTID